MGVAPAALAAPGDDLGLAVPDVGDYPAGLRVLHKSSYGHPHHQILGRLPRAAPAPAVLPPGRGILALVPEVRQGGEVAVPLKDDAAAAAAVPAVGAACRHVLLPVEGHGAVPAVPGLYIYFCHVYEHNLPPGANTVGPKHKLPAGLRYDLFQPAPLVGEFLNEAYAGRVPLVSLIDIVFVLSEPVKISKDPLKGLFSIPPPLGGGFQPYPKLRGLLAKAEDLGAAEKLPLGAEYRKLQHVPALHVIHEPPEHLPGN